MTTHLQRIAVASDNDDRIDFGGWGVTWKIEGDETGDRFSVVHHPIAPRALVAPLHRHHNEDEYSFVIEGTLGALLGDEVVSAGPGTWVFKPRDQWHTFWNAGDTPCEIVEVISPAGFETFFRELAELFSSASEPAPTDFPDLCARYSLDLDPDSVPGLCERFGLTYPSA